MLDPMPRPVVKEKGRQEIVTLAGPSNNGFRGTVVMPEIDRSDDDTSRQAEPDRITFLADRIASALPAPITAHYTNTEDQWAILRLAGSLGNAHAGRKRWIADLIRSELLSKPP